MKKSIPKKEQEMTPELKQINSEKTELNKILSENLGILKKRLHILNNADFTADTNKAILELKSIKKLVTGVRRDLKCVSKKQTEFNALKKATNKGL